MLKQNDYNTLSEQFQNSIEKW